MLLIAVERAILKDPDEAKQETKKKAGMALFAIGLAGMWSLCF